MMTYQNYSMQQGWGLLSDFMVVQLGCMVKGQTLDKGGQFLVLFKPLMYMHNYHVTTEGFRRRLLPNPNCVWPLYRVAQKERMFFK